MKIAVFSTKAYDRKSLTAENGGYGHEFIFFEAPLNSHTYQLANGFEGICAFVNDDLSGDILRGLHAGGVRLIVLRCSGFNQVDIPSAEALGMTILRVPAYSPQGVAEHAIALIMALNRQIYRAHNRVRDHNFSLEGLLGFEIAGLNVGIIGTGAIGKIVARILKGFGSNLLGYDPYPNDECKKLGLQYVSLEEIFHQSDIISLHMPLMRETHHIINDDSIAQMKRGVMLINISRGGLIDTEAVLRGLKSGQIGYLGLDVYEEEGDLFFEDLSNYVIKDDVFARLTTFPNVMITPHQAFFTKNALQVIARTTLQNISDYELKKTNSSNVVCAKLIKR